MKDTELTEKAVETMNNSYSPYSSFCVGAALLCKNGKVYTGCNIENSSYPVTVCAERTAFAKAVSEGEKDFIKIAVTGGKEGKISSFTTPCGMCRQFMSEFCGRDFEIILYDGKKLKKYTLGELLPDSFSKISME